MGYMSYTCRKLKGQQGMRCNRCRAGTVTHQLQVTTQRTGPSQTRRRTGHSLRDGGQLPGSDPQGKGDGPRCSRRARVGGPVDIIALILPPPDQPGQHLGESSAAAAVGRFSRADVTFCQRLRQADSAEEVMAIVQATDGMTHREWNRCTDPAAMLRLL